MASSGKYVDGNCAGLFFPLQNNVRYTGTQRDRALSLSSGIADASVGKIYIFHFSSSLLFLVRFYHSACIECGRVYAPVGACFYCPYLSVSGDTSVRPLFMALACPLTVFFFTKLAKYGVSLPLAFSKVVYFGVPW